MARRLVLCASVLVLMLVAPAVASAAGLSWSRGRVFDRPRHGLDWVIDLTCPSARLCVAVDRGGNILTSTDPARGVRSWHRAHITVPNGGELFNVSCGGPSWCLIAAGGSYIVTSTDPAAGVATWQLTNYVGNLGPFACPSLGLCVTFDPVGHVVWSTNPFGGGPWLTSGRAANPDHFGVLGIACPTVSLCAAGGDYTVVVSTDPVGGARTWRRVYRFPRRDLSVDGLDCPSRSLCVASSFTGVLAVSKRPASRRAWRTVRPPSGGFGALGNVSCGSPRLCVIADGNAFVLSSTRPAGGWRAWHVQRLGREHRGAIGLVACASRSLCLAVDADRGIMYVGRKR